MQATGTFGGSRLSKRAAATVAALLAVLAIGGAGGFVAKSVLVGQAEPRVAGPLLAPQTSSGYDSYSSVRSGLQTGDGAAGASAASDGTGNADVCIRVNGHKAC